MPSALDLLLSQLRRDLENAEAPLRSQLVLAYESAITSLEQDLYNVTWLIEDAQARGIDITPDWLYRQDRYQRLIQKAEMQLARFTQDAIPILAQTDMSGAALGARHATPLLHAAGIRAGFGTNINTRAVDILYQLMFNEGPLKDVLDSYGANAAAVIRHEMGQGVIRGLSPREVVRTITRELASGTNRARLSTLVRTEHMRSYRMSQAQQLEQYAHAIKGYRWSAAMQTRTCLACIALDGDIFDTPQDTFHPNCRCICVPVGYHTPDKYKRQPGEDWFAQQDEATQRAMMPSQAAFDAYKRGDVKLRDFVGERNDPVWGRSVYQKSGKQAMSRADRAAPSTFVRPGIKSVTEGQAWAKSNLKTKFEYDTFKKVTPDYLDEALGAFSEFEQRTGRAVPAIVEFSSKGMGPKVTGKMDYNSRVLRLRPNIDWESSIVSNAAFEARTGMPFNIVQDVRGLVWHESGHAVDAAMGRGGMGFIKSRATQAGYRQISGYANTAVEETWAEAFASYATGYRAEFLPDDLRNFIATIIKEKP